MCSQGKNRCGCSGEERKEETAGDSCGCICLCLEFSTREAVDALLDRFKEVARIAGRPVDAVESDDEDKTATVQKGTP